MVQYITQIVKHKAFLLMIQNRKGCEAKSEGYKPKTKRRKANSEGQQQQQWHYLPIKNYQRF